MYFLAANRMIPDMDSSELSDRRINIHGCVWFDGPKSLWLNCF